MEQTTQQRIEMLQREVTSKIETIAYYINKDLGECALIELEALQKFQQLQFDTMVESMPGKFI